MKLFPLIIITILYILTLTLYNFSLYKLLTDKEFGHQYYLILLYFLCEIFSFFHYFISKKEIMIGDINPYIVTTEMSPYLSISDLSNNISNNIGNNSEISNIRNNSDNSSITITSNNLSPNDSMDSDISTIPFIGIKCISFILSGFIDFLSKLFIYNGIKYMNQDSILRCLIEIIIVSLASFFILRLKNIYYSIIGLSIIIVYLLIFILSQKIKANIIGIVILSEGGFINSILYLVQYKFFIKGEQFIYRIVSWEGLYGTIFGLIFLILASLISCPFEQNNNNDNKDNDFAFTSFCNGNKIEESLITFLSAIKNNVGWFILYLISCLFYSFLGVFITKYINVIYRVSLDTFRMLFFIIAILIFNQ